MSDCIEWAGYKNKKGYGKAMVYTETVRKCWRAHRLVWTLERGEIPPGVKVLHRCDNRACVNIEHLFLGTQADNMRDMISKGRGARGETIGISKLTEERVREIRASPLPAAALARSLGICPSTISLVRSRKTWSHVHP